MLKDWLKPRTVFAMMFYLTYLILILSGHKPPAE